MRRWQSVLMALAGVACLGMSGAGFAYASTASEAGDPIHLPARLVGDAGSYTVQNFTTTDGQPLDAERPYLEFTWLPPTTARDSAGFDHAVDRLSQGWPGRPSIFNFTSLLDVTTGAFVGIRGVAAGTEVAAGKAPLGPLNTTEASRYEVSLTVLGKADTTIDESFCGLASAQFPRMVPMKGPWPAGSCRLWGVGLVRATIMDFTVTGRQGGLVRVDGLGTFTTRNGGESYNVAVAIWLQDGFAYPLRVEVRASLLPDRVVVHRLASFHSGTPSGPPPIPDVDRAPQLENATRHPWGPDETGIVHPFPLSQAYGYVTSDARGHGYQDYIHRHPHAYLAAASYSVTHVNNRTTDRAWELAFSDGGDEALPVTIIQRAQPVTAALLPDMVWLLPTDPAPRETVYVYANETWAHGFFPPPDELPSEMPSVASLLARWEAYVEPGMFAAERSWSFDWSNFNAGNLTSNLGAGVADMRYTGVDITLFVAPRVTQTLHWSILTGTDVLILWQAELVGGQTVATPLDAQPPVEASAPMAAPVDHVQDVPALVLVSSGILAGLILFAAGIWPMLKAVGVGLFSRIAPEEALDNPIRRRIMDVVASQPGAHAKEIVRRVGNSRRAVEHHLAQLVLAKRLVLRAGPGYHCYFPVGALEPNLARAAQAVRAPSARAVLAAIGGDHRTIASVAGALGLAPSTIHYHITNLQAAGALQRDSAGAWAITALGTRLQATGMAPPPTPTPK